MVQKSERIANKQSSAAVQSEELNTEWCIQEDGRLMAEQRVTLLTNHKHCTGWLLSHWLQHLHPVVTVHSSVPERHISSFHDLTDCFCQNEHMTL